MEATFSRLALVCAALLATLSLASASEEHPVALAGPDWMYSQTMYEVNIRQYTKEGTFKAFMPHLARLKKMGVGTLWLMPIHPIGEKNRKGTLGSYYSVKDYYGVNPEFGTMDDFKALVKAAHDLGMYVIIDWVANHSAWDNTLTVSNPDWYNKDGTGNFMPPNWDWTDVIDFNFDKQELRDYMIGAMKFWVKEGGVDGFRCDAAGMVPIEFWKQARKEVNAVRQVLWLAEQEGGLLHEAAFDMTYGWEFYNTTKYFPLGYASAEDVQVYMDNHYEFYPTGSTRLLFTSNHDENSWKGSILDRYPVGAEVAGMLTIMLEGMPLVYSGQEAGNDKVIEFFEKDLIPWQDSPWENFYTRLLNLRRNNPALHSGKDAARVVQIKTSNDKAVYAFKRTKGDNQVVVLANLTDKPLTFSLKDDSVKGTYKDVMADKDFELKPGMELNIPAWDFKVLAR